MILIGLGVYLICCGHHPTVGIILIIYGCIED
jgi:hypothetical protein